MKWKTLYLLGGVLLWGCQDDTFAPNTRLTPETATPRNLVYPTVGNAREFSAIFTGKPTLETGGLVPSFEIVAGYDAEGNSLAENYMSFVSIASPTIQGLGTNDDGEPIEGLSYLNAGRIRIADGNPFSHGDYAFDVKVTTLFNGNTYSTTFSKGAKITVLPTLPSALLYIPMAQNLVIGAGTSTTTAYLPSGNPDISYSLGSETEKLTIDPVTGSISLQAGYAPSEEVSLTPTIIVTSNISNEEVVFEGSSSLLTIVVSSSPVTLPLQESYFFVPTLASNNLIDGYRTFVEQLGSMTTAGVWARQTPAGDPVAAFRPTELKNNYMLVNNSTVNNATLGDNLPHDSWVIFIPQNLANYNYGFELTATFWLQNQYVRYLSANGKAPCELRIMVSTDYATSMSSPASATWSDVTATLACDVAIDVTTWTSVTTGLPYPGTNGLVSVNGSTDNDEAKALKNTTYQWQNPRWVRCVLDLEPWKNATSFTLAIHQISNYEGPLVPSASNDQPGRFTISDVYYKAKEKPANP